MRLLRDVREATRLLILLEVTNKRPRTLKPLAEALDMTIQGVSEYVKAMADEGLLRRTPDGYRPTKKGVEFLHGHIRGLREFVERSTRDLRMVDVTAALAGADLQEGQEVGLFMEEGHLVAYPGRPSPSTGRALYAAQGGHDVAVGDLQGILDLRPGSITLVVLPSVEDGGSGAARGKAPRPRDRELVLALDPVGLAYGRRLAWSVAPAFAPLHAALDAAIRGQDVVVLLSRDLQGEALAAIEATNASVEDKIKYTVVDLSRRG